jgi:hypothetical protein
MSQHNSMIKIACSSVKWNVLTKKDSRLLRIAYFKHSKKSLKFRNLNSLINHLFIYVFNRNSSVGLILAIRAQTCYFNDFTVNEVAGKQKRGEIN